MMNRTSDLNNSRYGGRGIKVCERWRLDRRAFYKDLGVRPKGWSLHRIDNDRHYSCGKCRECLANGWPSNCRWATHREQQDNRSDIHWIEFKRRRKPLSWWARKIGMNVQTLHMRIKLGWSPEEALTIPLGGRRPKSSRASSEAT